MKGFVRLREYMGYKPTPNKSVSIFFQEQTLTPQQKLEVKKILMEELL